MTLNKMRLAWLKVNFHKSCLNSDTDDESTEKVQNEKIDHYEKPELNSTNKVEMTDKEIMELMNRPITNVEFSRKIYLMLYNLTHLYGTIYILMSLILKFSKEESSK